jgi:L-lactate transport
MNFALLRISTPPTVWPQPLDPLHSVALSALAAVIPLAVVLILMGVLRKSGLFASACGLASAAILALWVWGMPVKLALGSVGFGLAYAIWPIMWVVFTALWLYNLCCDTGKIELLRRWMEHHASGDPCIQAILVAFCFGSLIEGTAGFGAPVAMTSFLLVGLGFQPRRAVIVSLIANTAPVAFGSLGIPIVALAGVTGLDVLKLAAMTGRQIPLLSLILPAYLVLVVGGGKGLRRCWPAALVAGLSFSATQFVVSNLWGPYAADILASLMAIAALTVFLRIWRPEASTAGRNASEISSAAPMKAERASLSDGVAFAGWLPWALLSAVMVLWSYLKLFQKGQAAIAIPGLHNAVLITLYQKPYAALYAFQPMAAGTACLVAAVLMAVFIGARPRVFLSSGKKTLKQLRLPGLTVMLIVGLAYLYNYSGMAYTLGAAVARMGRGFPLVSSYLGWAACFLSGSDTASNLLFGNLQVAAARQLHLNPILLAATNCTGAVTGKMISPQNIAVGVTTVGLIGEEGSVLRGTFWHSVLLAAMISVLAYAQAYWMPWMVP